MCDEVDIQQEIHDRLAKHGALGVSKPRYERPKTGIEVPYITDNKGRPIYGARRIREKQL